MQNQIIAAAPRLVLGLWFGTAGAAHASWGAPLDIVPPMSPRWKDREMHLPEKTTWDTLRRDQQSGEPLFPAPPSSDGNKEAAFISAGISTAINFITLEFP